MNYPTRLNIKLGLSGSTLLLFFCLIGGLQAQDIKKERVGFDKGTTSATIDGSIAGYEIIDYIINVREGQLLNASMVTDNTANYFNIMEPGEDYVAIFNGSINENMYEGELKKSGDYKLRVYMMRSAARRNEKANYRLEIIVSALINQSRSYDAKVAGTDYHATGKVACRIGNGKPTERCDFGVIRGVNGDAKVDITLADGSKRTIFFNNGEPSAYTKGDSKFMDLSYTKENDLYIITIGEEQYEIVDAVIFGG